MNSLIKTGAASAATTRQSQRELDASFTAGVSAFEYAGEGFRTGLVGDEVALKVRKHLETVLPGRIRKLKVCVAENSVVLTGSCISYYTKQLAQHEARVVLVTERLVNDIAVEPID